MKKTKPFFQTVLMFATLWLAAYSANLRAEDIDIYVDNAGIGNTPNVLFVIDNSSNMGSNWSNTAGCQAYANSTEAPSIGPTTAGGIVQCALVDAISSLPNGGINIGIMSGNASGFATSRGCVGKDGGCLLYPLTEMKDANKAAMVAFVKSWIHENATKPGQFPFTVQSVPTDGMMQEAWAYYNGKTGRSGRTYENPPVIHGCQKNFIIYIGNTDKTPSNDAETGPLLAAATTVEDWRKKIVERQVFKPDPGICGAKKIGYLDAGSSSSDWSSNWGDEWARLMFKTDAGTAEMEGVQNVTTYSIGIINNDSNQCTADYPALLQSMGVEGGGKAFRVSNASEVTKALAAALNEVQAVNSVFSSASLPVSVNAEGSYLNQIFLGMFRPDSSGAPRWLGNLKQYQLVRTTSGALVMGDSKGNPALSSGGTGFLSPDAISFWTYKDPASLPDNVGGFFVNNKMGTPGHGFDLADGEVVEKGGVAQQLRKQNLVATFEGAGGTTDNPRKVYTFCPHGGTDAEPCQKDLKHADNDFSTANTKIAAATFGSAVTVPILSIVRTGTEALVTTSGNHGFTASSAVTIRNSDQPEYNKTQNVTVVNATQFKITGLPDYPTTPSTAGYTISVPGSSGTFDIASMSRTSSATVGSAAETVTVTTTADHPYMVGQTVQISGVTPAEFFAGNKVIVAKPAANQFTFSVPIYPASPALNSYSVAHRATSAAISSITAGSLAYTVETSQAHGFHAGQTIVMQDVKGKWSTEYNKTHTVVSVVSDRIFTIGVPAGSPGSNGAQGSVSPSTEAKPAATVSRNGTTVSTTATVTGMPAKWFANGDKVNITSTGTYLNEDAYKAVSEVTISCSGDCTSFTYPITATPPLTATGAGQVSIPGAGASATVGVGSITRAGTTATVSGVTPGKFLPNSVVQIQPTSGTALSSESGYVGSWQINCGVDTTCSSFSFGPVTLSPTTPATGLSMQAYSGNTAPDKDLMIKWLRGQDNQGDEKGPGNGVTVRPSMHGDVLHSRPLVVNYGDSRGIVVFYGSNDGVYRAVNGNQKDAANGAPAGGELWGLILPEHYQLINRYRANSPELKFPSTFLTTAQPKDYFVDGPTGVYQKLKADGSIDKAYIYLTMRRGGRLVYAIDVTDPTSPKYMWHISQQTAGFEELGQTWSRPRLTLLQNHKWVDPSSASTTPVPTPVLVFGAGYDPSQDSEPPRTDTMGRGMFVINAITGNLVWSASKTCDSSKHSCVKVDGMKYATSSDISFVDRDLNGYTDKMYWGDLGGNLWRADVSDPDITKWAVTRVAQLGCDTGECAAGTTPRKFFFPPAVLSVRASGATDSYEALSIVSGDREHPLRSDAPQASYNVTDKFFMIKDLGTTVAPIVGVTPTSDVTASSTDLFDATSTLYDNSRKGFYITLLGSPADSLKGEKAVNAPVAVNGMIFFSTNRPIPPSRMCAPTLGEAKAYAVSPFTGKTATNVLQGGGLPPSAVSGLITITETDAQGNVTGETQEKFCIGCGLSGEDLGGTNTNPCTSALENCNIGVTIPKNLKRTYWYKK